MLLNKNKRQEFLNLKNKKLIKKMVLIGKIKIKDNKIKKS
jgi:hypothetical protein